MTLCNMSCKRIEKGANGICEHQGFRPAWTAMQADQSLTVHIHHVWTLTNLQAQNYSSNKTAQMTNWSEPSLFSDNTEQAFCMMPFISLLESLLILQCWLTYPMKCFFNHFDHDFIYIVNVTENLFKSHDNNIMNFAEPIMRHNLGG